MSDRETGTAETKGEVTPALRTLVRVSDEGCARYGQVGRVEHVDVNLMLPIKVLFDDGRTVGFRSWELAEASAPAGRCSCQPHPIFGHYDECRYVGTGR